MHRIRTGYAGITCLICVFDKLNKAISVIILVFILELAELGANEMCNTL